MQKATDTLSLSRPTRQAFIGVASSLPADERLSRDARVRSQRLLERLDGERALPAGLSADVTNKVWHFIRD